jgi:endonuclease YncB( thermonuclease family)
MKTLIAAAALAAILTTPALAKDRPDCADKPLPAAAEGEAFSIDGDTIAVTGLKPHIRLWGIQAAELRVKPAIGATGVESVPGMIGRAALEDTLADVDHRISYEPLKWDRYCRIVGRVWIKPTRADGDKIDVSQVMLTKGAAYGFWLDDTVPGHPELGRNYAALEAFARKGRVGLWKDWLGEK